MRGNAMKLKGTTKGTRRIICRTASYDYVPVKTKHKKCNFYFKHDKHRQDTVVTLGTVTRVTEKKVTGIILL